MPAGRVPVSSYRAHRADEGRTTRWMVIAAAGLGGMLLLGFGGWAVMGRKPAVVPVIEADSRPLRVKPENPGGMQFAGADEAGGTDRVAPAPEVPNPQALRAQRQAPVAAPPTTPSSSLPTPVTEAQTAPVPAGTSPLPDTPVRPTRQPAPAPAAATPGKLMVQVAALDSEAGAQAEWARLSKKLPDLLGSRRPVMQRAESDGKAVWRVRTGGFTDMAEATGFCGKLKAKGAACTVASF